MKIKQLTLKQSLSKAYRLIKPERAEIEKFKANFKTLLLHIDIHESEENMKNHVMDFLKNTWYTPSYHIATKGRTDFVIHTGKNATHPAGVLFETKKPRNPEMVTTTDLNRKAMHEIILYYLRERIEYHNNDIKYLVITNIFEWFVFDAPEFERLFFNNKSFVKEYKGWIAKQKVSTNNDLFYNEIAKPFLSELSEEIQFTWFDIRDYEKEIKDGDKNNDNKLIPLFKILSPTHLLKLPFANDSNSLDKGFYNELLYIIGLEEVKEGNKKLIRRRLEGKRINGSLLENTIVQLETENCVHKIKERDLYGDSNTEQLFSVALELCITWVNRVLFLKLLEAQLLKYHKGNDKYRFLNYETIPHYDELYKVFFQVLARKHEERIEHVRVKYEHIPYLNSSLFDITALEAQTIRINMLDDSTDLPLLNSTILKNNENKPIAEKLNALQYIFEFLNAYDFASEGSEEIQEERKTLINAAVLGLIFEKINGYKDGSIYTPGFITMYMCRQTIRQTVVNKFKEKYNWKAETFEDLHNYVSDNRSVKFIKEYNELINSITICDPAVGSGHFLVSALNELIAIKSELGILADSHGRRLGDYIATVENDELQVTTKDGNFFTYYVQDDGNKIILPNKEVQRVQQTLFHEKEHLIENSLFGVDINPKSVQICRLRLWIELLKNAYYVAHDSENSGELQTLPNIDINIKTGNSLISRFALDEDLKPALIKSKFNIDSYKLAVQTYKEAETKEQKWEMQDLINVIKKDFSAELSFRNKLAKAYVKEKAEVVKISSEINTLKLWKEKIPKKTLENLERASGKLAKLEQEIQQIKENKVYNNAFEWRFEFPEVLDSEGRFVGFDILIANPPYIRQEEIKELKPYLKSMYKTYTGATDLFVFFIEKGIDLLKANGQFCYIIPNKWLQSGYGEILREVFLQMQINFLIDFGDLQIFEEATTYPCIINITNRHSNSAFQSYVVKDINFDDFETYLDKVGTTISKERLSNKTWIVSNHENQALIDRFSNEFTTLTNYINGEAYRGIVTGLTEAFIIGEQEKEELISINAKNNSVIKPLLQGRDLKPYITPIIEKYLLFIPWHFPLQDDKTIIGPSAKAERIFKDEYGEVYNHLETFKLKLSNRNSVETGIRYEWYALQRWASEYWSEFEKPKIMYQKFQIKPCFIFDEVGLYCNDSIWFIPSTDKVLLAILNSKVGWYLVSKYCTAIQNGYQLIWKYFSQIPIAKANEKDAIHITSIVDKIIQIKKENSKLDTIELERQLDLIVYNLYKLTPDEVTIIESALKKKKILTVAE
jgi:adenine-specific DNA-methyltransferase